MAKVRTASLLQHGRQAAQYGLAGVLAVIADYIAFACLLGIAHVPLAIATVASQLAGFIVSFSLNRLWVFKASGERAHSSPVRQLGMYTLLFVANTIFTYLFIRLCIANGVSPYIAKVITIGLITTWNFALFRLVIFRTKPNNTISDTVNYKQ